MTGRPRVVSLFHEPTLTASHLVLDPVTREAAVVDPVLDFDAKSGRTGRDFADGILEAAAKEKAHLRYVLETHAHADHLTAAPYIKERTGAAIVIGEHIRAVQRIFRPIFNARDLKGDGSAFDRLVKEGDTLPLGSLEIGVLHTPGHTPACVTYLLGDAAFIGDTMFMPDYGTARADFPGGDARRLYRSIQTILRLPEETRLFLCHDYLTEARKEHRWKTTVAAARGNVHLRACPDEESFVAFRKAKDAGLEVPTLLLASIQVNIRAGHFPPPEDDGHVCLKLPVDRL
jgi:glyoxylase-like metal-dependent hydrolase (beta-lactamase superfamily II)